MPRSHIKPQELHDLALEVNRLLGTPEQPWVEAKAWPWKSNPGCHLIESENDNFTLVAMTNTAGSTRLVLGPTHRGALLRQMQAFILGIKAAKGSENEQSN